MTLVPTIRTDKLNEPFHVRPYRSTDRAELQAMYEDFEPKRTAQGLPPGDTDGIRRWLDRVLGSGTHVVVEIDGHLMGHAMLIPMNGDDAGSAELANFLHQSIRDRGIGTELNRIAVGLARERGYERVWLSVEPSNRPAVRSYEKVGFRRLPGSLWAPEVEMEVVLGGAA